MSSDQHDEIGNSKREQKSVFKQDLGDSDKAHLTLFWILFQTGTNEIEASIEVVFPCVCILRSTMVCKLGQVLLEQVVFFSSTGREALGRGAPNRFSDCSVLFL